MATTVRTTRTIGSTTPAGEAQKVFEVIRQKGIKVVDVKFTDLPGQWQHFSLPVTAFEEDAFRDGLGFDGSSIRGFQAINESDMLLVPDPSTRDPRFIAFKAEEYLRTTGIATTSYWGPEAEFFIFTSVRLDQTAHEGYYHIDSEEGI